MHEPVTRVTVSVTVDLKRLRELRGMLADEVDLEDDEIIPHVVGVIQKNFSSSLMAWLASPRAYGQIVKNVTETETLY